VTLFFLPEFCQTIREKWGKGVEIPGRNGDKFGSAFVENNQAGRKSETNCD